MSSLTCGSTAAAAVAVTPRSHRAHRGHAILTAMHLSHDASAVLTLRRTQYGSLPGPSGVAQASSLPSAAHAGSVRSYLVQGMLYSCCFRNIQLRPALGEICFGRCRHRQAINLLHRHIVSACTRRKPFLMLTCSVRNFIYCWCSKTAPQQPHGDTPLCGARCEVPPPARRAARQRSTFLEYVTNL